MFMRICLHKPKILLHSGLMQRAITFPFYPDQPPVKIDISSSLSLCVCLTSCISFHIFMHVSTASLSFVILLFPTSSSLPLSFFLVASSVWFFLFIIFIPQSPSHMTHWKTNSSHSEMVRDVENYKQWGKQQRDRNKRAMYVQTDFMHLISCLLYPTCTIINWQQQFLCRLDFNMLNSNHSSYSFVGIKCIELCHSHASITLMEHFH